MKTVDCIDFMNNVVAYKYAVGKLSGDQILIFIQDSLSSTSITNMIEKISEKALFVEFPEIDPSTVRIFEYYPSKYNPTQPWQEVKFGEIIPQKESVGIFQRIFNSPPTENSQIRFLLKNPRWQSVKNNEINALLEIIMLSD